jgi:hypothetical protein
MHAESGRAISISYDVEIPSAAHDSDSFAALSAVTLISDKTVHLQFETEQDALDFLISANIDDFVHGHYLDATGTAAAAAPVQPFHARVLAFSVHSTDTATVQATIKTPELTDLSRMHRSVLQ